MTLTAHRPSPAPPVTTRAGRRPAGPHAAAPRAAGARALTTLVLAVLGLTLVGAVLAALQLVAAPPVAGPAAQSLLRTPYGLVAVGDVTVSVAVDASKGMVGKGHAVHTGAASGAGVRVNVPVTLQNQSDAAVRYTPGQFRLDTGDGRSTAPEDSPLLTGELRPGAAVALRLTFALASGATSPRLTVDGGQPAAGLDLQLPAATTPGQQLTPQDQPAQPAQPGPAQHSSSGSHGP